MSDVPRNRGCGAGPSTTGCLVARISEIELLLTRWGDYQRHTASSTLPSSAKSVGVADQSSARDVEDAVSALPPDLQATVCEVYVIGGPARDRVERLGCPESTIARRIGRAHLLLVDLLATRRAHRRLERERDAWARRLADRPEGGASD